MLFSFADVSFAGGTKSPTVSLLGKTLSKDYPYYYNDTGCSNKEIQGKEWNAHLVINDDSTELHIRNLNLVIEKGSKNGIQINGIENFSLYISGNNYITANQGISNFSGSDSNRAYFPVTITSESGCTTLPSLTINSLNSGVVAKGLFVENLNLSITSSSKSGLLSLSKSRGSGGIYYPLRISNCSMVLSSYAKDYYGLEASEIIIENNSSLSCSGKIGIIGSAIEIKDGTVDSRGDTQAFEGNITIDASLTAVDYTSESAAEIITSGMPAVSDSRYKRVIIKGGSAKTNTVSFSFDENLAETTSKQAVEFGNLVAEPELVTKAGVEFLGWFDKDGNEFNFSKTIINDDLTLYASFAHIHSWVYEKENGMIVSYCKESGLKCDFYGTEAVHTSCDSVSIECPQSAFYDGNPKAANLNVVQIIDPGTRVFGNLTTLPSIVYKVLNENAEFAAMPLNELPTEAGKYEAGITIGAVSLSKEYTIDKAESVYTSAPSVTAVGETIKGKNDGKLCGLTSDMEYKLSTEADDNYRTADSSSVTDLASGVYTIRYKADKNHKASASTEAAVSIGKSLSVSFDSCGGSSVSDISGLSYLDTVDVPLSSKSGYRLMAWNTKQDGSGETLTSSTEIKEDTLYYAIWKKHTTKKSKKKSSDTNESTSGYDICTKDSTCPLYDFSDLKPADWYHDGIHYCLDEGYMIGYSTNDFRPSVNVTRAQIVSIIWRIEGSPVVNYKMDFTDVSDESWYCEAVRWAASEGIVKGYEDGSFKPDAAITREALAQILYNYEKNNGGGFTGAWMFLLDYPDANEISGWANEALHWTVMKGITNGNTKGLLNPKGNATRAEAACMIQRFCELE